MPDYLPGVSLFDHSEYRDWIRKARRLISGKTIRDPESAATQQRIKRALELGPLAVASGHVFSVMVGENSHLSRRVANGWESQAPNGKGFVLVDRLVAMDEAPGDIDDVDRSRWSHKTIGAYCVRLDVNGRTVHTGHRVHTGYAASRHIHVATLEEVQAFTEHSVVKMHPISSAVDAA